MPVRIRPVAVAGVVAAAAVTVPAVALASGTASPPAKPPAAVAKPGAPASKPGAPASKPGAPASKPGAPASKPGAPAAKKAAARSGSGDDRGLTGRAAVAALASRLGISTSAARNALQQIVELSRAGLDPANPAFAAVARSLGVSSVQLADALSAAKQALAGR